VVDAQQEAPSNNHNGETPDLPSKVLDERPDVGKSEPRKKYPWRRTFQACLITIGLSLSTLEPTLYDHSNTPSEVNIVPWFAPVGIIAAISGGVWILLEYLYRSEQTRARSIVAETPAYHISGEGFTLNLSNPGHTKDATGGLTNQPDPYMARQERMLEDSYVQAISQARVMFWVSVAFMCLGATILLVGATSAILSGGSSGKVEAGIVSTIAGTVSSLISGTFLYQANRSRDGVTAQATRLQARSMADRRISIIREVATNIDQSNERTSSQRELISALVKSLDKLDSSHVGSAQSKAKRATSNQKRNSDESKPSTTFPDS
jgi:hypothetical protein